MSTFLYGKASQLFSNKYFPEMIKNVFTDNEVYLA